VYVFGHHYISVHEEIVACAYCLEGLFKLIACCGVSKVGENAGNS
jgi:hypothetical protein